MDRRKFFKRLGIGAIATVAAPAMLVELCKPKAIDTVSLMEWTYPDMAFFIPEGYGKYTIIDLLQKTGRKQYRARKFNWHE